MYLNIDINSYPFTFHCYCYYEYMHLSGSKIIAMRQALGQRVAYPVDPQNEGDDPAMPDSVGKLQLAVLKKHVSHIHVSY